jgi:hypothetical protein
VPRRRLPPATRPALILTDRVDAGAETEGSAMPSRGARQIRETANTLLDAFITAVEQAFRDARPSVDDLRKVAAALKETPDLDVVYEKAYGDLQSGVLSQAKEAQRVEVFHRLMTHPLDPLLDSGQLSRDALPNFFNFLRLVLGEDVDILQAQCVAIHDEIKEAAGETFTWDAFYADPRAKAVLYRVLARIADAFRRFETRRDWFIGVMQYTPTSISLSSNAFMPNKNRDTSYIFGPDEFQRMFRHLFAVVKNPGEAERAVIERELGAAPEQIFGPLLQELGL